MKIDDLNKIYMVKYEMQIRDLELMKRQIFRPTRYSFVENEDETIRQNKERKIQLEEKWKEDTKKVDEKIDEIDEKIELLTKNYQEEIRIFLNIPKDDFKSIVEIVNRLCYVYSADISEDKVYQFNDFISEFFNIYKMGKKTSKRITNK